MPQVNNVCEWYQLRCPGVLGCVRMALADKIYDIVYGIPKKVYHNSCKRCGCTILIGERAGVKFERCMGRCDTIEWWWDDKNAYPNIPDGET